MIDELVGSVSLKETTRTVQIANSTSTIVSRISLSSFESIEYYIGVYKADKSKVKTLKMLVSYEGGILRDSVYGRQGDMQVNIEAQLSGSNLEIVVYNLEVFNILCSIKKTLLD